MITKTNDTDPDVEFIDPNMRFFDISWIMAPVAPNCMMTSLFFRTGGKYNYPVANMDVFKDISGSNYKGLIRTIKQ